MPEVNQNPQRACLRNLVVGEFSTEILLENAKIKSWIAFIPKKSNLITFF